MFNDTNSAINFAIDSATKIEQNQKNVDLMNKIIQRLDGTITRIGEYDRDLESYKSTLYDYYDEMVKRELEYSGRLLRGDGWAELTFQDCRKVKCKRERRHTFLQIY